MKTKSVKLTSMLLSLLMIMSMLSVGGVSVSAAAKFPPVESGGGYYSYDDDYMGYPVKHNFNSPKQLTLGTALKNQIIRDFEADGRYKVNYIEYYGTLSDGSSLVFVCPKNAGYFTAVGTYVIGKYLYQLSTFGMDVQLYQNHQFYNICNGYKDGIISNKQLDEIAKVLCFDEFIDTSKPIDKNNLDTPHLKSTYSARNGVEIKWYSVYGADKYRVFVKDGNTWKKLGDTTSTSFTDKTAVLGRTYTYTVRCVSKDGKKYTSGFEAKGVTETFVYNLGTPWITKVEGVYEGVKISWEKVDGAEKYRVFVKDGNTWRGLGDTTSTSFVDKNVKSDTRYIYTVRCVSNDGKIYVSGYRSSGDWIYYIAAPKVSSLTNETNGVKITWGRVTGAVNYRVYVKSGSSWKGLGNTTSTSFVDKTAKSGTTYTYTVRCVSDDGTMYESGYNTTGWNKKFVATPKVSSLTNETNGVKITWGKVAGAENYRVYVKGVGSWKGLGNTTSTSFVDKTAKSGTTYTYTVRCVSKDGKSNVSGYNATGWSKKFIAAPQISSLTNSGNTVKITWGKVAGAQNYRVFVKDGSSWKKLGDTTSTTYTHTGVKSNTTYTYTVRCLSADKKSFTSAYNTTGKSIKTAASSTNNTNQSSTSGGYTVINGMAITYPTSVSRGSNATVSVKGAANTSYRLGVTYGSGESKASGLGTKTSNASGNVSWTWKVGNSTTPGTYPITITQGGKTATVYFKVV